MFRNFYFHKVRKDVCKSELSLSLRSSSYLITHLAFQGTGGVSTSFTYRKKRQLKRKGRNVKTSWWVPSKRTWGKKSKKFFRELTLMLTETTLLALTLLPKAPKLKRSNLQLQVLLPQCLQWTCHRTSVTFVESLWRARNSIWSLVEMQSLPGRTTVWDPVS